MNSKILLYFILAILLIANGLLQQMGQDYIVYAGVCLIITGLILSIFHKTLIEKNIKPTINILSEMNPTYVLIYGIIIIGGGVLYIWHGLKISGSIN